MDDGGITAHFEYDAFGRTIASTGVAPAPFGFSTKYLDTEANLYYYGYRYYSPELGRWLSRDPIEEGGGVNLYVHSLNNAVNWWDILGLQTGGKVEDDLGNECCPDELNTWYLNIGFVGGAGELEIAGIIRDRYNADVRPLTNRPNDPLRKALKTKYNSPAHSTASSRALVRMHNADEALREVEKSMANSNKSNAAVNRAGAIGKWGGRTVIVAGVAYSVCNVATADDTSKALVEEGSSWLGSVGGAKVGAVVGAKAGALIGAIGGPLGAGVGGGIGAVIGGIAGGISGGWGGREIGGSLHDTYH